MPRLLDLFCGAGGCSAGYASAGFDVTGVDLNPQPNYPHEFVQADAMTYPLDGFDVIHASPPCQAYSITKTIHGIDSHEDLLGATRRRLEESGSAWVIENVQGAPLARGSVMLCGLMFGLKVYRHRWFESNCTLFGIPPHPKHDGGTNSSRGYSSFAHGSKYITVAGHNFRREDAAEAMGIEWMTRPELAQAIPPAYTEWIGRQVLQSLAKQ